MLARAVDNAHAAVAEFALDDVPGELEAGRQPPHGGSLSSLIAVRYPHVFGVLRPKTRHGGGRWDARSISRRSYSAPGSGSWMVSKCFNKYASAMSFSAAASDRSRCSSRVRPAA